LKSKRLNLRVAATSASGEPLPTAIHADRDKVQQILMNLLRNAIKCTAVGGTISIGIGPNENLDVVSLYVRDTGRGIEDSRLEEIFQPFVQLHAPYTGDREGVGLGLAISRDLARAMGGDIHVESVVGQGTTFTVDLPRA
jgi:signal transduction histidine kinase